MSIRIWSVVSVTLAFSAMTSAQTLQVAPRVTVIGCIQRSEPPTARTDTTVVSADETPYVLINITLAENQSAASDGRSAVISENVNRYRLQDSADGIIATHVGDRVEVTGSVVASSDSAIGTTGKADATLRDVHAPILKVESVKIITGSTACSS
jgi:hypothetical protein